MSMEAYTEKVASRFNLQSSKGYPHIPLAGDLEANPGAASAAETHFYQSLVGSVIYPTALIRLDLAFSASFLARFLTNPSSDHLAAANRAGQFLYSTKKRGLLFDGFHDGRELEVFSDASFADDAKDRKSSQGHMITLFGTPVAWQANKQATVTTSSTEAELLALSYTAKETMAIVRLFAALRFNLTDNLTIFCNNKQTIRLVTTEIPRLRTALKHVDVHNAWIRQETLKGTFQVKYLESALMPADGLTKPLPRVKFDRFVQQCGLVDVPDS